MEVQDSAEAAGHAQVHEGNGADPANAGGANAPAALESSVFPAPPAEYLLFTSSKNEGRELGNKVLAPPLPPRVDWIDEDGYYSYFGDQWPIPEVHPTLEQQGVTRLYPDGPHDRRAILQSLLQTALRTYLELVATLQRPPNDYVAVEEYPIPPVPGAPEGEPPQMQRVEVYRSDAQDQWEHLRTTVINMQDTINRLRPVQARDSLKSLMQMQLDRRKAQTEHLRKKCAELRAEIKTMHEASLSEGAGACGRSVSGCTVGDPSEE
ncbi:unnamed protein product [Tilletia controversa]|uniref:Mediator of RNA polymerase II transcription subunit 7 n=2 Tax=Tilletia TaxID=13289 RepID=A0A8X7MK01_9BASI|nr:hypothetical protein CF328_g6083 [Tilletia controversa]KAE8192832.1 hypothetical protein CF336_g4257 [Tilletia laevis]KAE8260172.1 hypothetical protein A4X03_0g3889 [Tilletia caries]KAE8193756.1 hypothetical protein CF335_g5507 [Tilletia laevis]KAE8238724.1 hypothetical protein A4X06_0g8649 [Tilletia controversa]